MATVYSYDRTAARSKGKLVCDQDPKDGRPVTHTDSKGYVYCTQHAEQLTRGGRRGVRKLRPQEIKKLEKPSETEGQVEELYCTHGKDYP